MVIWKFGLFVKDVQAVLMPKGAQVLCVQVQNGSPCIWALVDQCASTEKRIFRTYGTGHMMGEGSPGVYAGTYQLPEQGLVFHVFEDKQ